MFHRASPQARKVGPLLNRPKIPQGLGEIVLGKTGPTKVHPRAPFFALKGNRLSNVDDGAASSYLWVITDRQSFAGRQSSPRRNRRVTLGVST